MKKYKAICLDLDGTVYKGVNPIPEAVEFIEKIQKNGLEPFFITNNSSATQIKIQEKLLSFGVEVKSNRIMTSAIAAATYCKENYEDVSVMIIGEEGLKDAFTKEGFFLTDNNPDVVVMGIDREITYAKLANASIAIRNGAHFIATNSDLVFPTEKGLVPGNGSFAKLVELTSGKSPVYIGKPESQMLRMIQSEHGFAKSDMVMIGDNYDTDILAGIHFGIDTIHVEGGVTSREEVLAKEVQPTHLYHSLII
ncbi:TIGR01457 family HAD-type hydrolase [Sporosarcina sp. CAU 1771]